ncbi:MAG: hypothetical protein ABI405_12805 [Parafilimonas sp.]
MYKKIIPFYIICFVLYVLFSRHPDFQDGEITSGNIHYIKDSTQKTVAKAIFSIHKLQDTISAAYPLRYLKEGQNVKIIYETSDPSKAAVYAWWGYWFQWDEISESIFITVILLYSAKAITAKPALKAEGEELGITEYVKRKKYN